jgi:hypothetical protein
MQEKDERSGLAALLKEHQEEIATAWAEMVRALPDSSYADLSAEEVRSLALRAVEAMVESLESGSRASLEGYLADICPATSEAIPDTPAATGALLLCKDAAVPLVREACSPDTDVAWALVSELDACLRWMVARLTSMCAAEMAQRLHEERSRLATLLEMAHTVGSTLELDEVVSRAAEQILGMLGADRCVFHLVDEAQRTAAYLSQPSDWSSRVVRSFEGCGSMFHEALTTRRPVTSYDLQSDPRIPRDHKPRDPDAKSGVMVPLLVKDKVVAEEPWE